MFELMLSIGVVMVIIALLVGCVAAFLYTIKEAILEFRGGELFMGITMAVLSLVLFGLALSLIGMIGLVL